MKEQKARDGQGHSASLARSEEPLNEMHHGGDDPNFTGPLQDDTYLEYKDRQYLGTPGEELTESAIMQKSSEEH
jgi:hypothetical protein